MSNNNIEKFIRQHRRDFDSQEPAERVWEEIVHKIPVHKPARRFTRSELFRWTAAAAVMVAVITSLYFIYIKDSHEQQPVSKDQPRPQLIEEAAGLDPEFGVQLLKVSRSVENRQEQLKAAAADAPALYQQFEKDLEVLDSSFRALKNQALQTPNRDVLIRAMIQNLQLQSELLERQLQVMQEFNNKQKVNHESTI